jgi:hypothetical protein
MFLSSDMKCIIEEVLASKPISGGSMTCKRVPETRMKPPLRNVVSSKLLRVWRGILEENNSIDDCVQH